LPVMPIVARQSFTIGVEKVLLEDMDSILLTTPYDDIYAC
jgi:hypothetical protein